MRRGLIAIRGTAGAGLGHGMIAGTILVLGDAGRRIGAGMKRGTLVVPGLALASGGRRAAHVHAGRPVPLALPDGLLPAACRLGFCGLPGRYPRPGSSDTMATWWSEARARSWPVGTSHDVRDPRQVASTMTMSMNRRALWLVEAILAHAQERKVILHLIEGGGRYIDCGIEARGGLLAGLELARVCMGELASVEIVPGELAGRAIPLVQVVTDHPVQACLASQYAGWAISEGKYFAMGSGPMRAVRGREPIYDVIGFRESENSVVGVLETRKPPPPSVVATIAAECRVTPASRHPARRADGQPGRRRSGRRPVGRDGPAQAGRAQVRPRPDPVGAWDRPRCLRSRATTWRPSAGPTTRSSTAVAWSST